QLERGARLLQEGNSFGLLDLIQACKTAADIPEMRRAAATVWAGWYGAGDRRLVHLMGHQDGVSAMAMSPDGKLLATGSLDDTARLWEAASGKTHGPPLRHQDRVRAVAFSPDGKLLATASEDRTVRVWDTATGQPVGLPLRHE